MRFPSWVLRGLGYRDPSWLRTGMKLKQGPHLPGTPMCLNGRLARVLVHKILCSNLDCMLHNFLTRGDRFKAVVAPYTYGLYRAILKGLRECRRQRTYTLRNTLPCCSAVRLQYEGLLFVMLLRLSYSPWFRHTLVDTFKSRRTQTLPALINGPSSRAPDIK